MEKNNKPFYKSTPMYVLAIAGILLLILAAWLYPSYSDYKVKHDNPVPVEGVKTVSYSVVVKDIEDETKDEKDYYVKVVYKDKTYKLKISEGEFKRQSMDNAVYYYDPDSETLVADPGYSFQLKLVLIAIVVVVAAVYFLIALLKKKKQ